MLSLEEAPENIKRFITEKIALIVNDNLNLSKRLDREINNYVEKSNFYTAYGNIRMIINSGLSVKGLSIAWCPENGQKGTFRICYESAFKACGYEVVPIEEFFEEDETPDEDWLQLIL